MGTDDVNSQVVGLQDTVEHLEDTEASSFNPSGSGKC